MKKQLALSVLSLCLAVALMGQDQHFTQFYASPLTLNPALTGQFEGKLRMAFNYRDQWRKVLDNPYSTFSAAADFRFPVFRTTSRYKDAVGVGVLFFNDKIPGIDYSNNQMILSGAFHKGLSKRGDHYISLGIQAGINQRSISYDNLTFNDQFNGTTGFTDPTGEALPENNFAFGDYNVGLNYTYAPERKTGIFLGAAMHHILEPATSFFFDKEQPERFPANNLHRKYTAHLGLIIPLGEIVQLSPRALFLGQGPHAAATVGANFRFLANDITGTALHVGTWYRAATNEQRNFLSDAAILVFAIEHNNFLLGFSYDATLTDFTNTRRGQGAFEVSLAYLGLYDDELIICPKF